MTWKDLLETNKAQKYKTSTNEISNLREALKRNLADAVIEGLSDDRRFVIAYEAVLVLAKIVASCSGYRIKGHGAHEIILKALMDSMGTAIESDVSYFDVCRRKRHRVSYDTAWIVSKQDADDLFQRALAFQDKVEKWISDNYPEYKKN